jgi:hypothetical protein
MGDARTLVLNHGPIAGASKGPSGAASISDARSQELNISDSQSSDKENLVFLVLTADSLASSDLSQVVSHESFVS